MTREEAEEYAKVMTYREAIYNLMKARSIPYRKATFIKVNELLNELEQEPQTGHWIEKDDNLYVCSECGQYIYSETEHDLLEFHAFCGKCGARMVEPQESEGEQPKIIKCPNCGNVQFADKEWCPDCGAKMVEYTGDGYVDGKMVYDMANCPNCGREFEDGDETWNCNFCPDCGQALKWEGEEE